MERLGLASGQVLKLQFVCGIDFARKQLGDDYAKDRNLADNLRVYLTRAAG